MKDLFEMLMEIQEERTTPTRGAKRRPSLARAKLKEALGGSGNLDSSSWLDIDTALASGSQRASAEDLDFSPGPLEVEEEEDEDA